MKKTAMKALAFLLVLCLTVGIAPCLAVSAGAADRPAGEGEAVGVASYTVYRYYHYWGKNSSGDLYNSYGNGVWKNYESVTSTTPFPEHKVYDGHQSYRKSVSGMHGSVWWLESSTVMPTPTILTQPTDYYGPLGSTATFTVEAEGVDLSYQWWVKKPTATRFSKSSITTAVYSVALTEARNGNQLYCVVTDSEGDSVQTDTVTMIIGEPLAITADLEDYVGPLGSTASFTVEATGDGLAYQWWVKSRTAAKFTKSSVTASTYRVTLTEARNGNQVYCVITDARGNTAQTNTVTMTVAEALSVADLTDCAGPLGSTATFTVEATGEGLSYQWWVKKPTATKFSKSSVTGPVYEVELTEARNGNQIYCVVTDAYGNTARTNTVTMTVAEALSVADLTDCAGPLGSTVSFTVEATGEGLSYQWWVKKPTAAKFSKSSITGPTYSVELTEARNGNQVYCVVTDAYGNTVRTNTVSMTIG